MRQRHDVGDEHEDEREEEYCDIDSVDVYASLIGLVLSSLGQVVVTSPSRGWNNIGRKGEM